MRPTVRQLEYMIAVADTLNFRRAAARCHVTQPALSAQIQEIEAILGLRIFERDRRRVLVTAAGKEIVARGRLALSGVDDVVDIARTLCSPLSGDLKLGVIPTIAPYVLPSVLPVVRKTYPSCRLLLVEDQTAHLVQRLSGGELDVLLLAQEADLGSSKILPLFKDEFVVVFPRSHRFAARKVVHEEDLQDESVLLLEDGHCLRDQTLGVCQSAGAEEGDFRATSLNTLVQMVAHGVGITLLPQMAIENELGHATSLVARRFVRPRPYRTVCLAWRSTSPRDTEFRLLGDILKGDQ